MADRLERNLEEYYLYVLAGTTYKEICQSEDGIKNYRGILQLIKGWDKTLIPENRDSYYTFDKIDDSISVIKTYISNKYTGAKKMYFEQLLLSPAFCQDLKNLFARKIYEYKYQQEQSGYKIFQSTLARKQTVLFYLNKTQSQIIYKAVGSTIKKVAADKINDAIVDVIIEQIHHEIMLLNAQYIGTRPYNQPKKYPSKQVVQGMLFSN